MGENCPSGGPAPRRTAGRTSSRHASAPGERLARLPQRRVPAEHVHPRVPRPPRPPARPVPVRPPVRPSVRRCERVGAIEDGTADRVGPPPQVLQVCMSSCRSPPQAGRAEVGGEPAAVQPAQRRAVGEQRTRPRTAGSSCSTRRRRRHCPGCARRSAPGRPPPGEHLHPLDQVGHDPLGVAGRRQRVDGARPEGADVPQDADGPRSRESRYERRPSSTRPTAASVAIAQLPRVANSPAVPSTGVTSRNR